MLSPQAEAQNTSANQKVAQRKEIWHRAVQVVSTEYGRPEVHPVEPGFSSDRSLRKAIKDLIAQADPSIKLLTPEELETYKARLKDIPDEFYSSPLSPYHSSFFFAPRVGPYDESAPYDFKDEAAWLYIRNLDWPGLVERVDRVMAEMNKLHRVILDLRGTAGDDPEIASCLAARFVSGSQLLSTTERSDGFQFVRYDVTKNGVIRKLRSVTDVANDTNASVIGKVSARYTGDLVVVVNQETQGTAEALAYVLQKSGRAKVFGVPTKGRASLTKFFSLDEEGKLVLAAPARTLLTDRNDNLHPVVPDFYFDGFGGLSHIAAWMNRHWYDSEIVLILGMFVLTVAYLHLVLLILVWLFRGIDKIAARRRNRG
jgi:hypothetical protein